MARGIRRQDPSVVGNLIITKKEKELWVRGNEGYGIK